MRFIIIIILLSLLGACTAKTPLSPGLVARMDENNAKLNMQEAIAIINDFRAVNNVLPLIIDKNLTKQAQKLAMQYAKSGKNPQKPKNVNYMGTSAGYVNFAQTFSGWRNNKIVAQALLDGQSSRAGIGVYYEPNSENGTYWVLLLADNNIEIGAN